MKKNLLIGLSLTLLFNTALAQTNASSSDVDQAITHLREGLIDSFNKGDIDRLLTFLDTNAVVTWQNGEVSEGTAAVKDERRSSRGEQSDFRAEGPWPAHPG
jgi:hypothetical protein